MSVESIKPKKPLERFRQSYGELKKLLGDESEALPSDLLAYSILKGVFQENVDFAIRCAQRTIEPADIMDLAAGEDVVSNNPLFEVLTNKMATDVHFFEYLVENLAHVAHDFGYK